MYNLFLLSWYAFLLIWWWDISGSRATGCCFAIILTIADNIFLPFVAVARFPTYLWMKIIDCGSCNKAVKRLFLAQSQRTNKIERLRYSSRPWRPRAVGRVHSSKADSPENGVAPRTGTRLCSSTENNPHYDTLNGIQLSHMRLQSGAGRCLHFRDRTKWLTPNRTSTSREVVFESLKSFAYIKVLIYRHDDYSILRWPAFFLRSCLLLVYREELIMFDTSLTRNADAGPQCLPNWSSQKIDVLEMLHCF